MVEAVNVTEGASFLDAPKAPAVLETEGGLFKIYHDGSHYVGIKQGKPTAQFRRGVKMPPTELEESCVALYHAALQSGCRREKHITSFIINNLCASYDADFLEEAVSPIVKKELHKYYERVKRFRRKAYLHPWNYFTTFTYNDAVLTEEAFKRRLPVCLSHLHTRREWNYMGVWERGELGGRLHFHALLHVPETQMVGAIYPERYYDFKSRSMRTANRNTFFDLKYGRSDFTHLNERDVRKGPVLHYLLKYLLKSDERIIYSRGIPTELTYFIPESDVILEYQDFCTKAIISDDFWAFNQNLEDVNTFIQDTWWGDIDELAP